ESAVRPGDPPSACVLASYGSRLRLRSTTQSSVPPAVARTSAHTHCASARAAPGASAHRPHKVQFRQQSLEPARPPTGFHPHPHLLALGRQLTVELLRFLPVPQSPLLQFPGFEIGSAHV